MRRVLRPIRLGIAGTCLLLVVGVVAAPSAAGAGAAGTAGVASRPWMDARSSRRPGPTGCWRP